jgi:hypothetical protein
VSHSLHCSEVHGLKGLGRGADKAHEADGGRPVVVLQKLQQLTLIGRVVRARAPQRGVPALILRLLQQRPATSSGTPSVVCLVYSRLHSRDPMCCLPSLVQTLHIREPLFSTRAMLALTLDTRHPLLSTVKVMRRRMLCSPAFVVSSSAP